jgi:hypothetical protein
MTGKHPITSIAISAAAALKLLAGRVLLTVLHDASGQLDETRF